LPWLTLALTFKRQPDECPAPSQHRVGKWHRTAKDDLTASGIDLGNDRFFPECCSAEGIVVPANDESMQTVIWQGAAKQSRHVDLWRYLSTACQMRKAQNDKKDHL
jgi:hypothetical protein